VAPAATVAVAPTIPSIVEPPPRGAWEERGWTRKQENGHAVYEGHYQVTDRRTNQVRRFRGRVVQQHGLAITYIADPPAEIKRHRKGPCFQLLKAPWFQLNWHRGAANVDDAILYLEKVLDEAVNAI
jgi:hypothetical protein